MSDSLYGTAIHEAAHAVVSIYTARGLSHGLMKNGIITIERSDDALGFVQTKSSGSGKQRRERKISLILAGGMAQQRVDPVSAARLAGSMTGDINSIISVLSAIYKSPVMRDASHLGNNILQAYLQTRSPERVYVARKTAGRIEVAATHLALTGNDVLAAQALVRIDSTILSEPWFKLLGELTNQTSQLLDQHWYQVHALANKLLEVGTMTGPEAEEFVRTATGEHVIPPGRIAA